MCFRWFLGEKLCVLGLKIFGKFAIETLVFDVLLLRKVCQNMVFCIVLQFGLGYYKNKSVNSIFCIVLQFGLGDSFRSGALLHQKCVKPCRAS